MKKLLIVAAVVAVAFNSCGIGGGSIKTDTDSLAYALGVDFGTQLKMFDSTMNPNIVAKGLIDVFKNNNKMDADSARKTIQEYMMVKLPAKKQKEETTYLESVEKGNPNIVKTESGLMYEIIMPGDETVKAVNDADVVKVKYTGRFKEGAEYDADKEGEIFDQNDEMEFPLNRVIKGWTEGMKLVGKGGKIRLWVPSAIGYGPMGSGPIGPSEPLVFDVELIDVTPAEVETPEEAAN